MVSKCWAHLSLSGPIIGDSNRWKAIWNYIPKEVIYHILDLRQADYNDVDIKSALDIVDVPNSEFIYERLGRCTTCFAIGHRASSCSSKFCADCKCSERACSSKPNSHVPCCFICNNVAHLIDFCPALFKCSFCQLLGHHNRACHDRSTNRLYWRPIRNNVNADQLKINSEKQKIVTSDYKSKWVWKIEEKKSVMPYFRGKSYPGRTTRNDTKKIWRIKRSVEQDDCPHVWNEHVALVAGAVEAVINGTAPGQYRFVNATGAHATFEVPLTQNLLDFLIQFYYVVCTPRLCANEDSQVFSDIYNGATSALHELVGMACFSVFPFSLFSQGTNTIIFSKEAWAIATQVLSMSLNATTHGDMLPEGNSLSYSNNSESSGLMDMDAEDVGVLIAGMTRKRRRPTVPLDISEVRHSTRSTRFMGFRPPSVADVQSRQSHVKPRRIPGITSSDVDMKSVQDTASSSTSKQVQAPPDTPIKSIQAMGATAGYLQRRSLKKSSFVRTERIYCDLLLS